MIAFYHFRTFAERFLIKNIGARLIGSQTLTFPVLICAGVYYLRLQLQKRKGEGLCTSKSSINDRISARVPENSEKFGKFYTYCNEMIIRHPVVSRPSRIESNDSHRVEPSMSHPFSIGQDSLYRVHMQVTRAILRHLRLGLNNPYFILNNICTLNVII